MCCLCITKSGKRNNPWFMLRVWCHVSIFFFIQRKNSFVRNLTFPSSAFQVFNDKRQFMGMVKISGKAGLKRPSGIALDMENETLYVLNLWSNSFSKFKLVRPWEALWRNLLTAGEKRVSRQNYEFFSYAWKKSVFSCAISKSTNYLIFCANTNSFYDKFTAALLQQWRRRKKI